MNFIVILVCLLYVGTCVTALEDDDYESQDVGNFHKALKMFNSRSQIADQVINNPNRKQRLTEIFNNFNTITSLIDYLKYQRDMTFKQTNDSCMAKIDLFLRAFEENQMWPLELVDSFGKPASGILKGSLFWLGEFAQCREIKVDLINVEYMTVPIQLYFNSTNDRQKLRYGFCIPRDCIQLAEVYLNEIIKNISEPVFSFTGIIINPVDASEVIIHEIPPLETEAVIALIIVGSFVLLVISATIYDIYRMLKNPVVSNEKKEEKSFRTMQMIDETPPLASEIDVLEMNKQKDFDRLIQSYEEKAIVKIFLGFSAYSNVKKIFQISGKLSGQLECLHGVRFLSIAWVAMGHSFSYTIVYSDNKLRFRQWVTDSPSTMLVFNSFTSVDSFFLLSGLLTSYLFIKEVEKRKLSPSFIIKYYVHRIWRIMPPYAIAFMISQTLTKYLGTGPLYPKDGFEENRCRKSWWTNLLFINNLVLQNTVCLDVAWYLANDMQFHFFAPIILIPMAIKAKKWNIFAFVLAIALVVINSVIIFVFFIGRPATVAYGSFGSDYFAYINNVYYPPWTRMSPFLIGLMLGYLVFENRKYGKWVLNKAVNLILWPVSIGILLLIIFIIYPNFTAHPMSKGFNIVYQMFSRSLWALGLAFIIFSCLSSKGGFVNKILCWPVWEPLSKLSYSIYLTHPMVLLFYNSMQEHAIHVQIPNLVNLYLGNLVTSSFVALLFSITFEMPLQGLEKFIFKPLK